MAAGIFRRRQRAPNQPLRVNASHPLAAGLGFFGWAVGVNRIWDALTGRVVDLSAAGSATGTFTRGAGDNGPTLRMTGAQRGGGTIYNPTSATLGQGTLVARFKPAQATGGTVRPYVLVGNAAIDRGLLLGMAGATSSHAWGVSSSNGWLLPGGSGVDEQAWRTVGVNRTPGVSASVLGWLDGVNFGSAGHTGEDIAAYAPTRLWFGRDPTNYFGYPSGDVGWVGYWHRVLSAAEHRLLHEEAWSLVAPASLVQGWRFAVVAGGGGYTLAADTGAFALTGTATGLIAARTIAAGAGAFTLAGPTGGLLFGRNLVAGVASFALTGTAAGLAVARVLAANLGAFSLAGVAGGLTAARRLDGAVGTFTLTGLDAGLTYTPAGGYTITADAGAFALTGQAGGLTAARLLSADAGGLSLSTQPAGLSRGLSLTAATGIFTLTGAPAGTLRGLALAADASAFSVTGLAADLIYAPAGGYTISVGVGALAVTGIDAAFLRAVVMPADLGAFTVTGGSAVLLAGGQPQADPRRTVRLRVPAAWPVVEAPRAPLVRMGRTPRA